MLIPKDTAKFRKELKKLEENTEIFEDLKIVIRKIINEETLDFKYREHNLSGKYKGFKDCHIRPDLILIYKIVEEENAVYCTRINNHNNLFKK